MRDPLNELRDLSGAMSTRPLPPEEVRRRGNRMRRRRTAFQAVGAAAAVAVIAGGGVVVNGNLTGAVAPVGPAAPTSSSPAPSPPSERAPEGGWLSEPPPGFPLDAFLPDSPRESGSAQLFACSDATTLPALDAATYSEGVWVPGPRQQDRQLYLFGSGTEAGTAYESVLDAWRECPPAPLADGGELRFEVTAVRPDRFWVFREAYDAEGEPAPALGPSAVYEVRRYGNAVFGASIWDPSGESPLLTEGAGRVFDKAMAQIDAASCVFLLEGCGDDVEEPAESPWVTQVSHDLPLEKGLPKPGGDVPGWTWSNGPDLPLSPVACGGPEDLPTTPVDGLRVEVAPPDESMWRHLLLFADDASAAQAYAQLRSSATVCAELAGNDSAEPMEMRWGFSQAREGRQRTLAIDGRMYATGTDVRVPGRALTRVVQIGNALLVARLDDASSAEGDDDASRSFEDSVSEIATELCVFATTPCERH